MILKTNEIKRFLSLSNSITSNSIIPVLSYIKIESGYATKTNLATYVQHKIDVDPKEAMLIDEKRLSSFLKACVSDEIEVTVDGVQGVMKEGKRVMKFGGANVADFPKFPEKEKEETITLNSDVLIGIGIASKNTASIGGGASLDFVHVLDGILFATDNHKFYCKKVSGVPNMVLDAATAITISQFDEVEYYSRGNYNFFQKNDTLYGFIRTETKTPNIKPFVMDKCPDDFIEIDVAEMVGYCDTVVSSISPNSAKTTSASFKGNKLSLDDPDDNFSLDQELNTVGEFVPDVYFIPKHFGAFLKTIGCSTVRLSHATVNKQALSVWDADDPSFFALLIGTLPEN